MHIFVMGIPHTKTTTEFTTCAYTMKVWNLCRMMKSRGHHVIHVGTEGSNPDCDKRLEIVPAEMQERLYGHPGSGYYNMDTTGKYQVLHDMYAREGERAIKAYCEKKKIPDHHAIICATWGGTQALATRNVPQLTVESGIGYHHTFSPYRVFESYAWLHFHWGKENKHQGDSWYDVVIPNAFDPEMFPYSPKNKRGDRFLYIGRLNDDKGVGIAIDVTKRIGARLLLVGPTDERGPERFLIGNPHVEYKPPVGVQERIGIMGSCKAAFVPSRYLEPFGGVNVELQMTGCPVITTDWGAYTETVLHGVTGYRCRTLEQFVWAAGNIDNIDNEDCHKWAVKNYSLERIAPMYEEFFQMILNLRGVGWPIEHPKRPHLNWLHKTYPKGATTKEPEFPEHVAPEIKSGWEEAIEWEAGWWGKEHGPHWDEEIKKQKTYARLMELPADLDMSGKAILDVGCGPASMLLRAKFDEAVGVDPLPMSKKVKQQYKDAGIRLFNSKAEDMFDGRMKGMRGIVFDEVWIYNCLQHVDNPQKILSKIKLATVKPGACVRLFEWIDLGVCPGHPHNLTEKMFLEAFPEEYWTRHVWNTGTLRGFGGTVTNKYLALHIERKYDIGKDMAKSAEKIIKMVKDNKDEEPSVDSDGGKAEGDGGEKETPPEAVQSD